MHKNLRKILMAIPVTTMITMSCPMVQAFAEDATKVQSESKEEISSEVKADDNTDKAEDVENKNEDENKNLNYPHWEKKDGKLFYYSEDGLVKKSGWFKEKDVNDKADNDNDYYLNDDYSAYTGWKQFSDTWYYFDENGVMLKGWQYINYKWYYLGERSEMKTGWMEYEGNKFYLSDDGDMAVGKKYIDGKWYYFATDGTLKTGFYEVNGNTYYSDKDGVMVFNNWIETRKNKYYAKGDGTIAKGKIIIDGEINIFDTEGKYLNSESIGNEKYLYIKYLNVGNADCSFIKLPSGETALIDTGDVSSREKLVNFLNSQNLKEKDGQKYIDYVIITHGHSDHIGGLKAVLENFNVGKVYLPEVGQMKEWYKDIKEDKNAKQSDIDLIEYDYRVYVEAANAMKDKGLEFTNTVKGEYIDENKIMQFVQSDKDFGGVGSPDKNVAEYYGLNDNSAFVYVNYGDYQGLFTGDAEWTAEKDFWVNNLLDNRNVDVLKVPHHGLTTSSTGDFLRYVGASVGIIPRAAGSVVTDSESYKNLLNAGVVPYEVSEGDNNGVDIYSTEDNWSMLR